MTDLADQTVCVVDNGKLFLMLALRLTRALNPAGFGRVLYYSPWNEDDPAVREVLSGDGLSDLGIERCDDYLARHDEIDLFCYPALGRSGEQLLLESLGKRVVGSKTSQELEAYRSRFRKLQAKLGMDVPPHVEVVGLSRLSQHLEPLRDKFIKVDRYRADFETTKWRGWDQDQGLLDELAVKFGPFKEQVRFLIEDEIKTEVEVGIDCLTVDGQTPSHAITGFEAKNAGYIGWLREYAEMDAAVHAALTPLLPVFRAARDRNFTSTEQRLTDTHNYLTDITKRLGFPSGSAQLQLYGNLPQLLFAAGAGEMVPIEPAAPVCVECLLEHADNYDRWRSVSLDEALWPWFNPIDGSFDEGIMRFPPSQTKSRCIGSINGIGNTVEEAYEHVKEIAALLDGQPVHVLLDSLPEIVREVQTAQEEHGMEITEETLPEPAAMADTNS